MKEYFNEICKRIKSLTILAKLFIIMDDWEVPKYFPGTYF